MHLDQLFRGILSDTINYITILFVVVRRKDGNESLLII